MRQNILLFAVILLSISGIGLAAPLASSYQVGFFQNWLPVLFAAIITALGLTVMYYFIGVMLNNPRIKGTALSELEQVVGTVFLIMIILGIMAIIGGGTTLSYRSALSTGPNPVTGQVSAICNNILVNSQVGFLNSRSTSANFPGPYPTTLPQATTAVCSIVNGGAGLDPVTANLDYGLASTYVIIANLTNQSIDELNGLYNLDNLIFFLRGIQSYADVCAPVTCIIAPLPREAETIVYYKLYYGYVFQRTIMPIMDTQANLSIYLYMTQLVLIVTLLTTWPYLLAAGILLRTFTITRRAGGLIIAAVIVGTIIYPILFLFQYTALNNLLPPGTIGPIAPGSTQTQLIGTAGQIPFVPLCGLNMNTPTLSGYTRGVPTTQFQLYCYTSATRLQTSYIFQGTQNGGPTAPPATIQACSVGNAGWFTPPAVRPQFSTADLAPCFVQKPLSFYNFPNAASVIRLYTCYPPDFGTPAHTANDGTNSPEGIIDLEVRTINALNKGSPLTILLGLSNLVSNLVPGSTPQSGLSVISPESDFGLPCGIAPVNMYDALTELINLYGMMSVVAFVLPIINILILLSATFGISSLLGGETSIIGLSRFI